MKPSRVLLFLSIVLCTLLLVSYGFPENSISITSSLRLKFPSIRKEIGQWRHAVIRELSNTPVRDRNEVLIDTISSSTGRFRMVLSATPAVIDSTGFHPEVIQSHPRRIEYPSSGLAALDHFFSSLYFHDSQGKVVRILHYGDSQIEGDRITSLLRDRLQQEFGGKGMGLLAAVPVVDEGVSVRIQRTGEWERYTYQDYRDSVIRDSRLGVMMSVSQYLPERPKEPGTIRIRKTSMSLTSALSYTRGRIFLGDSRSSFRLTIMQDRSTCFDKSMKTGNQLNVIEWPGTGLAFRDIHITLAGANPPVIYGISLEDTCGILVDNISLRGSAGLDFSRMDPRNYKEMIDSLHASLLILQFGVNVVPGESFDLTWYQQGFYHQLEYLRTLLPWTDILVVGVSDMSHLEGLTMESYENLEMVRDAMKNAAFEAGAAFWDLYLAMGGKNAMKYWVENNPPLARKDYTHLTLKGTELVATALFDALILDYRAFADSLGRQTGAKIPDHPFSKPEEH
jgi:hypothetical protein